MCVNELGDNLDVGLERTLDALRHREGKRAQGDLDKPEWTRSLYK